MAAFERTISVKTESGYLQVGIVGEVKRDLVLFHHGAGYTSQTWVPLISILKKSLPDVCFAAFDMRGHGTSASSGDLAFDDLVADTGKVLEALIGDQPDSVEVFLIGHSLGASILAALPQNLNFKNEKIKFSGLVMVDIIEETAVNSLNRMPEIIKDIPKSFKTIDIAVDWTLSSSHSHHNRQAASKHLPDIQNSVSSQLRINSETGAYEWIADLSAMAPFWDSWFVGLTKNFLNFSGSRLLILADTDYMDKEMIVAQMQGKFQLAVVRESGHVIQEDRPEELAEIVCGMIQKHLKLSQLLRNKH